MSHSCSRMTLPSSQRMIFSAKSAPTSVVSPRRQPPCHSIAEGGHGARAGQGRGAGSARAWGCCCVLSLTRLGAILGERSWGVGALAADRKRTNRRLVIFAEVVVDIPSHQGGLPSSHLRRGRAVSRGLAPTATRVQGVRTSPTTNTLNKYSSPLSAAAILTHPNAERGRQQRKTN